MTDWQAITPSDAAAFLNELLERDPATFSSLFRVLTPSDRGLKDHPSLQVRFQCGGPVFTMLGLINGMFGVDALGSGPIAALYDDDAPHRINCFVVRRKVRHEKADG